MALMGFRNFLMTSKIRLPCEILDVIHEVRPNFRLYSSFDISTGEMVKFFNVPSAFDIETTSGEDECGKYATMYVWMYNLYGVTIIGRTWDEYVTMMSIISEELKLSDTKRLVVYVHNLGYEFQFIRKHFDWSHVFALDVRKPCYAITTIGIEYRCSYILTGYKLSKVGEHLRSYPIAKMVGDLDYDKPRHSKTILTPKEIGYCVNDVRVVVAHIAECIETEGNITRIPLTKTGYVRRYCRNQCFVDYERGTKTKRNKYRELMLTLTLDPDEYKSLNRAFQGGFTHANVNHVDMVVDDVSSFDFTSSYPTVMVAEKFPMSKGEKIEIKSADEFKKYLKLYCCLFDIEFSELKPKVGYENYISESRCFTKVNCKVNNGRIVSGDKVATTITDVDFGIIKKMYTWKSIKVANFWVYKRGYLPTDFVKAILKLYEDKTKLKNVCSMEAEYQSAKEMLNSCYGMIVTSIIRDVIDYTDDWAESREPDLQTEIEKYNTNKNRFLYYPWGVWVTAYARRNLFTGICEFADDYVYSDTDSVKVTNRESHMDYINRYNNAIIQRLEIALDSHGIDKSTIRPCTISGKEKPLGVWDYEGDYKHYKTLGAKRYMVQYANNDEYSLTVSGLNKETAVPYMLRKYGCDGFFDASTNDDYVPCAEDGGIISANINAKNAFGAFTNELYIPRGEAGKSIHTYIDVEQHGVMEDYMGVKCEYAEKSSVHLSPADYSLSIAQKYADYILEVKEID